MNHVYGAYDLTPTGGGMDITEAVEARWIPLPEALDSIKSGDIRAPLSWWRRVN